MNATQLEGEAQVQADALEASGRAFGFCAGSRLELELMRRGWTTTATPDRDRAVDRMIATIIRESTWVIGWGGAHPRAPALRSRPAWQTPDVGHAVAVGGDAAGSAGRVGDGVGDGPGAGEADDDGRPAWFAEAMGDAIGQATEWTARERWAEPLGQLAPADRAMCCAPTSLSPSS